jgi:glycosyltransferase involved in cell wall biosynthesis
MKLWIIEIGEPLIFEQNLRLMRYGILSKELTKKSPAPKNIEITWWTSNFSHTKKEFIDVELSNYCKTNLISPNPGNSYNATSNQDIEHRNVAIQGIFFKVIKSLGYKESISLARLRHQKDFAKKFLLLAKNEPPPDLILLGIPTIENASAVLAYAKNNKIPFILDIRDEWPDSFLDTFPSILKPFARLFLKSYFKQMSLTCKNASCLIAPSKKFLDFGLQYAKRKQNNNDRVIPFCYPEGDLSKTEIDLATAWWATQGVDKQNFNCVFTGALGQFFDLDLIVALAQHFSKIQLATEIKFIICGKGEKEKELQEKTKSLNNISFHGLVDFSKITALLQMASIGLCLYNYNNNPQRHSLPNKSIEYLSAGLPILSNLSGELEALLLDHQCGITDTTSNLETFIATIFNLEQNQSKLNEMRGAALKLYESNFSKETMVNQFLEVFKVT